MTLPDCCQAPDIRLTGGSDGVLGDKTFYEYWSCHAVITIEHDKRSSLF